MMENAGGVWMRTFKTKPFARFAIRSSTEIPHKDTAVLRGGKVLTVGRRGVAALAVAVRERCATAN